MADDKTTDAAVRFPSRIALRVPRGLPDALEAVARQRHTSPSEWMRRAILGALEADGVHLRYDGQVEMRGQA
jgi:hypothetical protein